MTTILIPLTVIAIAGSGLMAGLFFVFSFSVMNALAQMPANEGMKAMQLIHRTILNSVFLTSFFGTALAYLLVAIRSNSSDKSTKLMLMNTAGNSNRDRKEQISFAQSSVIGLLRLLVPPHRDNEEAADYLRTEVGQNDTEIQWAAARPASLFEEDDVSDYELLPSPTRSAIFDSARTSRINVAHFMVDLITDHDTWEKWQGQMPVTCNKES